MQIVAWGSALALMCGLAACTETVKESPSGRRPNVLLISIDMLRSDRLSCYGHTRATSPAIDRLAAEGQVFETHVSSSSWTLPGHASLFTALPDSLHGAVDMDMRVAEGQFTLAERFQSAGWTTAGFYSGPFLHPAFGFGQGFERYVDCTSYGKSLSQAQVQQWTRSVDVEKAAHADITSPRVHAAFEQWLTTRDRDRPFFAFLHMWDVHYDFLPPPPYDTLFDPDYKGPIDGRDFWFDDRIRADMNPRDLQHLLALYDGEIAWTDSWIARIREDLTRAGVLDNTIVVITSDHGTEFFEHGAKGHRNTLHEEVVRIPLIVRWPSAISAGGRVTQQSRSIDVLPTLLELAGLPPAADVLGRSLVPLMRDCMAPHAPHAVLELSSRGRALRAVRTQNGKLIDSLHDSRHYWYDLGTDPRELQQQDDFASPKGRALEAAYLQAVRAMEDHMSVYPPQHQRTQVPSDVRKSLSQFGYTGDEPPAPR